MGDENVVTVVPEARAKAEAMRTFLATGGGLVSRGSSRNPQFRYQKGKLKGLTEDEGKSLFEDIWAAASGPQKDEYAKMAGPEGTLAPSEMAALGTGHEGPEPGVVYGSTKVNENAATVLPPSMTPGSSFVGPPRSAMNAPAPATPASMTPGNTFVGPQPPVQSQKERDIQEILGRGASDPVTMKGKPYQQPQQDGARPAPDFVAGPGKEWTGMSGGRRTYTNADELYGKAKPSISSMEERRNDYQVRNQPVGGGAESKTGYAGPRTPMPRGPASQREEITPREARPVPRADDPDILKKDDAAYAAYQKGFGGASDEEFKGLKGAQQKIYDGASSMDQARLVGNTLSRSGRQIAAARESEATANKTPKVGDVRNLPGGGTAKVVGVRPAGRDLTLPLRDTSKKRKPFGKR